MMRCPKCGKYFDRLLALSREDNETKICDKCGMQEAMEDYGKYLKKMKPRQTPYERTLGKVLESGNKWALENFLATHN